MKGIMKKITSIVLATSMIITGNGMSNLNLKEIFADEQSASIELSNGELISLDGEYEGNNIDGFKMGNTMSNVSSDLYMDAGSTVSFDVNVDTDVKDYMCFLASDANGRNQLKQKIKFKGKHEDGYDLEINQGSIPDDVDTNNVKEEGEINQGSKFYGVKVVDEPVIDSKTGLPIIDEETGEVKTKKVEYAFDLISVTCNDDKIIIKTDVDTKQSKIYNDTYYISFVDNNGKFDWVLKVHIMFKATLSNMKMKAGAVYVRQGKNVLLNMEKNDSGDLITDGFDWVVENAEGVQSTEPLGTVTTNKIGSTRFSQESSATFHADSDKGIGSVNIYAVTNSGIMMENEADSCIALGKRGTTFSLEKSLPIRAWVPATEISFTNEEYNIQVGSVIELNKLINAKSADGIINPNDEYVFTIPSSQRTLASIDGNAGEAKMTLNKPGKVELTCTAENSSVTAKCIINIIKPTTDLTLTINDDIIARYSDSIGKNATVRSGNELIVTAEESDGSDEELVWNEDSWNGDLSVELISDVKNIKIYRIVAGEVSEAKNIKMELSTNRTKIDTYDPGQVKASYNLKIFPKISDDNELITSVSYDGEEKYPVDNIDLFSGESVVVYADPEGILSGEPVDQIEWSIIKNSALISKNDYKAINSTNVLNATTINWEKAASEIVDYDDKGNPKTPIEPATLRAVSKSNPNVYKDIYINTKKSIEGITLNVGGLTAPTLNLNESKNITRIVYPAEAENNEIIEYQSEIPEQVSVDQDGKLTALKETKPEGVKIYAYVYHNRMDGTITEKRLMATMIVKVKEIGGITVNPFDVMKKYTDNAYSSTATATVSGEGSQAISEDTVVSWHVSNELVAELDKDNGKTVNVSPKKVGTTEIVASVDGAGDEKVSGESYLTVTAPINDANVTISNVNTNTSTEPDENAYRYLPNGAKQIINPVLTATDIDSRADQTGKYVLVEGTDYNVSDSFVEGKGIGKYTIRFTGSELYTASRTCDYKIFPKIIGDNENADEEIYVEEVGKLVFNGQEQKPTLKIVYKNNRGTQELVLDTDYTLGKGKTAAGNYEIEVTGKGNFTGKFIFSYTIHQFDLLENFGDTLKYKNTAGIYVVSDSVPDQTWNGTEVKPNTKILVYAKLVSGKENWTKLVEGTDYKVEFENNDHVGTATAIITGLGNYTETVNCDFKIVQKDLSNRIEGTPSIEQVPVQVYTGHEITPKISMTCNGVDLFEGVDYELSYSENINAKAKSGKESIITVTGIGNYTGSVTTKFTIRQANISEGETGDGALSVEEIGEVIYNGSNQVPTLNVEYTNNEGTLNLALGDDYTLGSGYKDVGEDYVVTINGKGNYTGSNSFNYGIKPYKLNDNFGTGVKFYVDATKEYVTEGNVADQIWNGTEVTVNDKIKVFAKLKGESGSWTKLVENTDYKVSYEDNKKVGTATAIITGMGNYAQTINDYFEIVTKDISTNTIGSSVVAAIEDRTYTGFAIEPKIEMTCNNVELVEGVDYELSYVDNIDANVKSGKKPTVIIKGIGNYSGTISRTFNILQADLSDTSLVQIDEIPEQYDCGTLLVPPITVRMGEYILQEGIDYNVFYGKQNSTDYNYLKDSQGVVTIVPIAKSNFTATALTTVREVKGSEQFFDIVGKTIYNRADDISIKQQNGDDLIKDAIYVNVERSGAVNSTVYFDIEAVRYDDTECDDIVQAYSDNSNLFTYVVTPYDSTNGSKAVLAVTGKSAGRAQIKLLSQEGTTRIVDVIVNDPAISVDIEVKDAANNKIGMSSGQYALHENHDYYLSPVLSPGKTDTVTWSVDKEDVATINEEGKLTTNKPGTVYVTVKTNPSEVSPGGVTRTVKVIVNENVLAENVFINNQIESEVDLKNGKTLELTGSALSNNGSNVTEELLWTSSNEDAVEIVSGQGTGKVVIKAVGPGSSIITYGSKLEAGVKATCVVTVTYDVTAVELSKNEESIIVTGSFNLKATFNENAEDEFVWTTSDSDIASISEYDSDRHNSQTVVITGVNPGTATITVKSKKYNKTATCRVSVVHAYAKEVFIDGEKEQTIEMINGDTLEITGTATSEYNIVTEPLTWETDNKNIVDVIEKSDDGTAKIKALFPGEAVISYGSAVNTGVRAKLNVVVYNPVTDIMFDEGDREVHVGSTISLGARFNASAKGRMTVTNSNDDVIEVTPTDDGICEYQDIEVKGLKAGTSTVTISAKNAEGSDVTAQVEITVLDNVVDYATIDGEASSEQLLKYGDTTTLKGVATSQTGDVTEKLTWKSSNEDAVRIVSGEDTDEVVIEAVGPGSSTISYGSDAEGGVRATLVVNVYYEVTEVKVDATDITLPATLKTQITATFNEYAEDEFVWTSSDESIVKIINDNTGAANMQMITIEAVKTGSAIVTVESKTYGKSATVNVTVTDNKAIKVLINNQTSISKTLKVNETMSLVGTAAANEGEVTEKLTWSTSNDKVVKIVEDKGNGKIKVKAVGAGNAVVTYASVSGVKATVSFKVEKVVIPKPVVKPTVKEGPKAGAIVSDNTYSYKVTKAGTSNTEGEISIKVVANKNAKTVKIPDTVTINGIKYKVTSIEANAFKNNKKITKVIIGKNIKLIGAKAFFGCKKLKKVIVKSKVLSKVGKKAFYRKGGKKLTIKVPRAKKKKYKKMFKRAKTNKYKVK